MRPVSEGDKLEAVQKVELMKRVCHRVYFDTESWVVDGIGVSLAYLLKAILEDDVVWLGEVNKPLVKVLMNTPSLWNDVRGYFVED